MPILRIGDETQRLSVYILRSKDHMQDGPRILEIFKDLVNRSYGVKSPDGRRFMKSPELLREFTETEAYVNLFMELVTDAEAGKAFLRGVSPAEIVAEMDKQQLKA